MFKDELAQNERYQEIVEEMKKLREEKKSIENQSYAMAVKDAEKMDLLKLDIKSDQEMLSDMAMNLYTEGKTVEIIDENNTRWVPSFNVRFTKDDSIPEAKPAIELAGGALKIEPF